MNEHAPCMSMISHPTRDDVLHWQEMKPTTSMFLALLGAIAIAFLGHWYLFPIAVWVMFFGFGCGLETGRAEALKSLSALKQETETLKTLMRCTEALSVIDRCGKGAPDVRTHDSVN